MALKWLERSMALHKESLLGFQRWFETSLQPCQLLYDNLVTVEKLIKHASPGETYHKLAPLILAVQCARVVRHYRHLSKLRGFPGVEKLEKDPMHILFMMVGSMSRAAKECLMANDHSMVAEKENEYAKMSDGDRQKLMQLQHERIIEFFNSAQEQHLTPHPDLVDSIAKRIMNVDGKYSQLRRQKKVSFGRPRSARERTLRYGSPITFEVLHHELQQLAKEQAGLIELIEDNNEVLKCFYIKDNQTLQFHGFDHREPSRLLRYLSQRIWDVSWNCFYKEISIVEGHQKFVSTLSTLQVWAQVCDAKLQRLQERYKNLQENQRRYVKYLMAKVEKYAGEIVNRFNSECPCAATDKMFHFKVINHVTTNGKGKS